MTSQTAFKAEFFISCLLPRRVELMRECSLWRIMVIMVPKIKASKLTSVLAIRCF